MINNGSATLGSAHTRPLEEVAASVGGGTPKVLFYCCPCAKVHLLFRDVCPRCNAKLIEYRQPAFMCNKVRELRKTKHMKQQDLAKLSRLRQPNLSRIERCLVEPRLATLERIAAALGVTVKELA